MNCGARRTVQIESQTVQSTRCWLIAGHYGQHESMVLDSDDNPISHQWSEQCPSTTVADFAAYPLRCHGQPGHTGAHWIGTGFEWPA